MSVYLNHSDGLHEIEECQKDLSLMVHIIFKPPCFPLPFLSPPLLRRYKDFRESERFLTWTQYTEPNKTDDWFSSMPLFDVANKNNDNGKTKINMHLKKTKQNETKLF